MAPLQGFIQPTRHHCFLEMGIQNNGAGACRLVVQMQVVVGNTAVPISPSGCVWNVMHRLQHERNRATCLYGWHEAAGG